MTNITDESNRLVIAYIGKPVGLKGHLKLHPQSDFLEQFKPGVAFLVNAESIEVESFDQTRMLIKFLNYDTVEKAKFLSNKELISTIEDSRINCKLGKEEFFWFDIISCDVFESDIRLGKITEIERFTGQDYLLIDTDQPLIDQGLPKTFLLPYSERYILSVDLPVKKIVVRHARDILEAS